ncbi:MAG TPA: DUF4190 domain-containing protein [Myxococcaceae bacterium]|nr:DUF4190 domain-containing protein [Myxococcaceae bacterium]
MSSPSRPRSSLALATLVVGLLAAFLPCLAPVAFILGGLAVLSIRRTPGMEGTRMAVVGMIVPLVMFPVWMSIARPRLAQARARLLQEQCRQTLRQIADAERRWHQDHGAFSADLAQLGVHPQPGDPYAYAIAPTGTATCSANLDEDPAMDVWSMSPETGEPHHDLEDLDADQAQAQAK